MTVEKVSGKEKILEAALALVARQGAAGVTMAQVARAARMSRQAVYLYFPDRGQLFVALTRYLDQKRGLEAEIQKIREAPTGVESMRRMVALQARDNPDLWALVRNLEAVRRTDPAVERSWQDRLQNRLDGCRAIMRRVEKEGHLRPAMHRDAAADLLWTLTSLRMWEDLVLERGWSAGKYEKHVYQLLLRTLIRDDVSPQPPVD